MSYLNKQYDELEIVKEGHLLWIYLNRPESFNAFTIPMIHSLVEVLQAADFDNDIRCMILSGRGKHFCAGGDTKNMLAKSEMFQGEANELRERYQRGIQLIPKAFMHLSTPIVAMINGAAIGAGLDVTCMCDMRVASDNAKFGETFAKIGLIPGDGGTYFLQRIVGLAKAMELTLTGDIIKAQEASEMGLVNHVVKSEELEEKVRELANKVAQMPPIATQMAKKAIYHGSKTDLLSHLDMLAAYQGITQNSSDHFAALKAAKDSGAATFEHK
jgi:2-(1,2-epoxy-1,2-dihydrophenyl)acetyl-CoA isomerase